MPGIGIVGAGIAGLHLGILLRRRDVEVTIYADRSAAELAGGRLLNTVMHHQGTLGREERLGVTHWDGDRFGWRHRYQNFHGRSEIRYATAAPGLSLALDYRMYLPALMADFEQLGGRLIVHQLHLDELEAVSGRHELLVVATGRGSMQLLFPVRADVPQRAGVRRRISAALVAGVSRPDPEGVTISCAPGVGELIEFPMLTAQGKVTALLLEALPGGPADKRLAVSPVVDPQDFTDGLREVVAGHFPATWERVDVGEFSILSPRDTLQGGLAPVLRQDTAWLPNGRLVMALGDAHVLIDPVTGQGANVASLSAEILGEAIADDRELDALFCRRVAAQRELVLRAAFDWTNLTLDVPPRLLRVHQAAASCPEVAKDFGGRHADPLLMWRTVATEQRVDRYLAGFAAGATRDLARDIT